MEEELKVLLVERLFLDLEPTAIETDTALVEYDIDSFLLLELIVAIEQQYGIRFEQEDINPETLRSIASLCAKVRARSGDTT